MPPLGIKAKRTQPRSHLADPGIPFQRSKELAASGLADTQLGSAKLLVIAVTFLENHAENVGDINDQSGDRAATAAAWSRVTSVQVIEFARDLGDTMISRVTSKKSPHSRSQIAANGSGRADQCAY